MTHNRRSWIGFTFALALIAVTPNTAEADNVNPNKVGEQEAAQTEAVCTFRSFEPDIVWQNGNRYVAGTAQQSCISPFSFTQTVCTKIQSYTGGPSGSWVDRTTWNCTGPLPYATVTSNSVVGPCKVLGAGSYRTRARARSRLNGTDVEPWRYKSSPYDNLCNPL